MWTTGPIPFGAGTVAGTSTAEVQGEGLQPRQRNYPADVRAWAQGFAQHGAGPHGEDYRLVASLLVDLESWPKPGFLSVKNMLGQGVSYPRDDGFFPICVNQLAGGKWAADRHGDDPVQSEPGDDFLQAVLLAMAPVQRKEFLKQIRRPGSDDAVLDLRAAIGNHAVAEMEKPDRRDQGPGSLWHRLAHESLPELKSCEAPSATASAATWIPTATRWPARWLSPAQTVPATGPAEARQPEAAASHARGEPAMAAGSKRRYPFEMGNEPSVSAARLHEAAHAWQPVDPGDVLAMDIDRRKQADESKISCVRRLREKHPELNLEQLSQRSGMQMRSLRAYPELLIPPDEVARLRNQIPREARDSGMEYARKLHALGRGFSLEDLSIRSGVAIHLLEADPRLWPPSPQLARPSNLIQRNVNESNASYARRLREAHPDLTLLDIAKQSLAPVRQLIRDFKRKGPSAT